MVSIVGKTYTAAFKKVSQSFDSQKDKEGGGNFYQKQPEDELPEDNDELQELLDKEVDEFLGDNSKHDDQGITYKTIEQDDKIFVEVMNKIGKRVRLMEPEEFMRLTRESKSGKGLILNSVY